MAISKSTNSAPPQTWFHYLVGIAFLACSGVALTEMRVREPFPGFQAAIEKAGNSLVCEGHPILGTYTGIKGIDKMLAFIVTAFWPGTVSMDAGFGIQQPYFLVAFFPLLVLFLIEAGRRGNRWSLIAFPSLYVPGYQTIGGAVIIPLYYLGYMYTAARRKNDYFSSTSRSVPVGYARALAPSLVIGYLLPTVAQFLPIWTPATQQKWIAFWQPSPLYPGLLIPLLEPFLSSSGPSSKTATADLKYLNQTYLIGLVTSIAAHVGTVLYCLTSNDPAVSLRAVFDPRLTLSSSTLVAGLRYIFLADFLIIAVASMLFAYLTIYDMRRIGKTNIGMFQALVYLIGGVVFAGPYAALLGVWYWREQLLAKTKTA